jgi:hypothetical protein
VLEHGEEYLGIFLSIPPQDNEYLSKFFIAALLRLFSNFGINIAIFVPKNIGG